MKTLERRLGLGGVLAISISAMLGSGLFVLPGLAAAKTGPSVWLAYLAAGRCVLPAALSKAELATAMPWRPDLPILRHQQSQRLGQRQRRPGDEQRRGHDRHHHDRVQLH